jgi:hypothetical protein
VWSIAKTCIGVKALSKVQVLYPNIKRSTRPRGTKEVTIDIVAQNGSEWIKVCPVQEKTLIWEFAKAGYSEGLSDDDDDEMEEDEDSFSLIKQAKALLRARDLIKNSHRRPQIRMILPRLRKDGPKLITKLLDQIKAMGLKIETLEDLGEYCN